MALHWHADDSPNLVVFVSTHYLKKKKKKVRPPAKKLSGSAHEQCGNFTSVDPYESVQPPFKLKNSKCCFVQQALGFISFSELV